MQISVFVSEILQQYGIAQTDVNKTSFITSLYMVFVPIIGIFLGQKLSVKIIIAVVISVIGLYFFSIKDGFYLSIGDFLVFNGIGAYSITEGIYLFLSHPLPTVLLFNGTSYCILRKQKETYILNA